jgi:5'-3' exonuclease
MVYNFINLTKLKLLLIFFPLFIYFLTSPYKLILSYVFDGKPPELKSCELERRTERRVETQKSLLEVFIY